MRQKSLCHSLVLIFVCLIAFSYLPVSAQDGTIESIQAETFQNEDAPDQTRLRITAVPPAAVAYWLIEIRNETESVIPTYEHPNDQTASIIPTENLASGEYRLIVTALNSSRETLRNSTGEIVTLNQPFIITNTITNLAASQSETTGSISLWEGVFPWAIGFLLLLALGLIGLLLINQRSQQKPPPPPSPLMNDPLEVRKSPTLVRESPVIISPSPSPSPPRSQPMSEPPKPTTPTLTVVSSPEFDSPIRKHPIEAESAIYTLGREGCDLNFIHDKRVSRKHAHITKEDGAYYLTDTSTNGTFLNRERLIANQAAKLTHGDDINLGRYTILRFLNE